MTCIIAYDDPECGIVFAADKMCSFSETREIVTEPKIFRSGEFMIGYAGSFRMGQLLRYQWATPVQDEHTSDDVFIYGMVTESLRGLFDRFKYTDNEGNTGNFLFSYKGKVYEHQCDSSIIHKKGRVFAVGTGEQMAIGCMKMAMQYDNGFMGPIHETFRVVSEYIPSVSSEYDILLDRE